MVNPFRWLGQQHNKHTHYSLIPARVFFPSLLSFAGLHYIWLGFDTLKAPTHFGVALVLYILGVLGRGMLVGLLLYWILQIVWNSAWHRGMLLRDESLTSQIERYNSRNPSNPI